MSDLREMALARRSICPCGYAVLHDHIGVGTVYTVDINSIRGGHDYRCGHCGQITHNVEVADCTQKTRPGLAPLPLALFLPEATQ